MEYLLPPPLAWIKPFLPWMPAVDVDVATLCSLDPPDWPTIDANDLINIIRPTKAGIAVTAGFKLAQLAHVLLWYACCQCNAPDAQPTLPTPPSMPVGAPAINPPNVVLPPSTAPCKQDAPGSWFNPGTLPAGGWDLDHFRWDDVQATTIRTFIRAQVAGTGHPAFTWRVHWFTGGGADIALGPVQNGIPGADIVVDWPVYPGAGSSSIEVTIPSGSTDLYGAKTEVWCGTPTGGARGDCSMDPRLLALLEQIYGLLTSVQRNYAPFAYIRGPEHLSISGTGSFAVDRLIGLDVHVSSYPVDKRVALGNPAYIKDLGWMSVSEADGMIQEKRVAQTDFTWFPQLGPIATQVNYALQDGVVLDIAELLPEP